MSKSTMALRATNDAVSAALDEARIAWQRGDGDSAETHCRNALALDPRRAGAWTLLGIILRARDPAAAGSALRRALQLDPRDPDILFHLGNLQREQRDFAAAIATYERALALASAHPSLLNNFGLALEANGQAARAEAAYRAVLDSNPEHPKALRNLAHLLCRMRRYDEAAPLCQNYLRQWGKEDVDLWVDYGICLHHSREHQAAEASLKRALALAPDDALILTNLGSLLVDRADYERAESMLAQALARYPERLYAASLLAYCRQHLCMWTGLEALHARVLGAIDAGSDEAINAFAALSTPMPPAAQLRIAQRWGQDLRPTTPQAPVSVAVAVDRAKLRLGYVSSDFGTHPMAFLLAEVWERHDRVRFETFAYAIGPREASPLRARIQAAFDCFVDCSETSIEQIAQRIHDDKIDVLIDLNGYTTHARSELFALRPAAVQINWLGYLGTLGADWYDYIVTDRFVTPEDQQPFFTERFLYLPDCYCPSDTRREVVSPPPTRAECGLPHETFVFCCFNNQYKILPTLFDVWMRLLGRVSRSVLWLSPRNAAAGKNLRSEAAARGIDPKRLLFAPSVPPPEHLARHVHADLFLDTAPYNAGTTANDALFMGLPVLTCAGATMASRVAASQLRAIGLGELVTDSLERYQALALELALRSELLAGYRQRLSENRTTHPLFDMARFAAQLDDQLLAAWANRGQPR